MASRRPYDDNFDGGSRRPLPRDYHGQRPPYQDRGDRYSDRYERRSSPPRRRSSPHDRSRTPPRAVGGRHDYPDARDRGRRDGDGRWQSDRYERDRSPERPRPRASYRDRDHEGYRSSDYGSRSRSRSPQRRGSQNYGGPPSREVLMEGLPPEMTEEDISKELNRYHEVELEDVRIIRDHQTRASRGFGFLRFSSIQKAKAFMEQNYPTLSLYGDESTDGNETAAKVRVTFTREKDDWKQPREWAEADWLCKLCSFMNFAGRKACFKCQTSYADMVAMARAAVPEKQPEFLNNGDSDASPDGAPSQFLLLRGLEPSVTEELLAKGVAKLYKPKHNADHPTSAAGKKGGAKVASTTGDSNLGAKEDSIRRVLLVRDRQTSESWRYGFAEFTTVEEAQAALTRFNSFDKFTISSKPVHACYIHAGVFVPLFSTEDGYEQISFASSANPAVRLQYWDQNAYVSERVVAEPDDAGPSQTQQKSAADAAAAAVESEGLVNAEEGDAKSKKRKATSKEASKQKTTVPAHLQFWSNRHAELHGAKRPKLDQTSGDGEVSKKLDAEPAAEAKKTTQYSYSDLAKMCCYLCARQFKTEAEVNKHERVSKLHSDNLGDEELKAKAVAKMAKVGLEPRPVVAAVAADSAAPEYRDRAKERRKAFGASKISLPMKKQPGKDEPPVAAVTAAPSKGAALLGKMGWTSGAGLGAQGTGATAAIATDMYAEGVGLGAQGGKVGDAAQEAGRNTTNSYAEFVERTKDIAKERFAKISQ